MTTSEPGASEVLTQGAALRPFATALRASRPAPSITAGLEVLVQEVIAAITTEPSQSWCSPSPMVIFDTGLAARRSAWGWSPPSAASSCTAQPTLRLATRPSTFSLKFAFMSSSSTRSCGRLGPASEGLIVPMSSSSTEE